MVPMLNESIGTSIDQDGMVAILLPRFKKPWMAKLFLPKTKKNEVRVKLDAKGSAVWNLIDGRAKVCEICNALTSNIEEAEKASYQDRLVLFLQGLYKSGWIKMYESNTT